MTNSKPTGQRRRLFDQIRTLLITSISSGANAKAVQRMLGHKSAAMTLDVYADLFEDDLDAVAVAMNEAAVRALTATGSLISRSTPNSELHVAEDEAFAAQ